VRTAGLLGQLTDTQAPSYLSGLLIGHEISHEISHETHAHGPRPQRVHLIGNDRLLTVYAHALETFGIEVRCHSEDVAAIGLHRLARAMA
jgi:2-dehydro-3-deoxygalactonokinase